jgi:hypothetical protein
VSPDNPILTGASSGNRDNLCSIAGTEFAADSGKMIFHSECGKHSLLATLALPAAS